MSRSAYRPDRGSLSVELAILMPLLLLLLAVLYAYGEVAQVTGTLEAGTRDAARAASQARSQAEAQQVARRAVESSLAPGTCSKLIVQMTGAFRSGFPITVTSDCTFDLGKVLPFSAGNRTLSSSFTSPLDPNRGVR